MTAPLKPGDILGQYKILRELGHGAMAYVYLAEETSVGRQVAMKVLSPQYLQDQAFITRFIHEAHAAASLAHPNIIGAQESCCENGLYFYCMEYADGESVQELIQKCHNIPIPQVLDIAIKVASALEYGWSKLHLTHGDIKPENIMLTSNGDTKLADFGLAKMEGGAQLSEDIILTPHYAAPELIRGKNAVRDCRSDIYAFGATLYHAISGTQLFPSTDAQEVLDRQMNENPEPLIVRYPSAPPMLSEFIGKMVAKNPDDRPQDWNSILRELKNMQYMLVGMHQQRAAQKPKPQIDTSKITERGRQAQEKLRLYIKLSALFLFLFGLCIIIAATVVFVKHKKAAQQLEENAVQEEVVPSQPVAPPPKVNIISDPADEPISTEETTAEETTPTPEPDPQPDPQRDPQPDPQPAPQPVAQPVAQPAQPSLKLTEQEKQALARQRQALNKKENELNSRLEQIKIKENQQQARSKQEEQRIKNEQRKLENIKRDIQKEQKKLRRAQQKIQQNKK